VSDLQVRIAALNVYPIKSCAGVSLNEALLVETGLEFDRAWMVVDGAGRFVTQRELPRMALIRPSLKTHEMVLRAPGMLALHIALDAVEASCRVTVWKDEVAAYDMGALAAQWFSDFLGQALRLVRFDPEQKRLSNRQWTGELEAGNAFSDGYTILVASQAGLDELNRRLVAAGHVAVTMERFRPNIVIDGVESNGEDHLDDIGFDTPDGAVRIKLVKPCTRCPIPDIDPATAERGHAVRDALLTYRADSRVGGAITFGMNAVVVEGMERELRVGQTGAANYKFD
jgi:uncharacterized protein YcbX